MRHREGESSELNPATTHHKRTCTKEARRPTRYSRGTHKAEHPRAHLPRCYLHHYSTIELRCNMPNFLCELFSFAIFRIWKPSVSFLSAAGSKPRIPLLSDYFEYWFRSEIPLPMDRRILDLLIATLCVGPAFGQLGGVNGFLSAKASGKLN